MMIRCTTCGRLLSGLRHDHLDLCKRSAELERLRLDTWLANWLSVGEGEGESLAVRR